MDNLFLLLHKKACTKQPQNPTPDLKPHLLGPPPLSPEILNQIQIWTMGSPSNDPKSPKRPTPNNVRPQPGHVRAANPSVLSSLRSSRAAPRRLLACPAATQAVEVQPPASIALEPRRRHGPLPVASPASSQIRASRPQIRRLRPPRFVPDACDAPLPRVATAVVTSVSSRTAGLPNRFRV
ncbi:uncharacterized protein LOC123409708 [Hordeum vulgare subsp. vulgare]|uniref:uncharacterized protein LOC123409708 n=1 Tax=Hordeum vulgare subsp. vulgare TaxID=112509 RepID=UPI001D1A37AE|nr:uncharacterized protein LOC123409708 [Hordeum vulgare subsp. vulgare]